MGTLEMIVLLIFEIVLLISVYIVGWTKGYKERSAEYRKYKI